MTTIEGLLSWEPLKLEQLIKESGDVAKLVNVFKEFLVTVGDERQRFANERNVLSQQSKVQRFISYKLRLFNYNCHHIHFTWQPVR